MDIDSIDRAINNFASAVEGSWEKNSKFINIMRHFKSWWDKNCKRDLDKYRSSKMIEDWKQFQRTVKNTK